MREGEDFGIGFMACVGGLVFRFWPGMAWLLGVVGFWSADVIHIVRGWIAVMVVG